MLIVFTDLDGTLLDHNTYSWASAAPALERLRRNHVPCIFVTSKTRAEVEGWRRLLVNEHPFVVENGGAAFVPRGYFPFPAAGAVVRGDYEVLEWGTAYRTVVDGLLAASEASCCSVQGFHAMSAEEISVECSLSLDHAVLAKQREYDEPFRILNPRRTRWLLGAIEDAGLQWTRGGRFYHVCGNNDKALAVGALRELYRKVHGGVVSIGLGDSLNDAPFLNVVDTAVLVRSRFAAALKLKVPHGVMTERAGPEGWSDALLQIVS